MELRVVLHSLDAYAFDVQTFEIALPDEILEELVRRTAERIRDERRFLSKAALAAHLGVSERRIKTMREHGLPARKIGRDLYFDVGEVAAWIDRHAA